MFDDQAWYPPTSRNKSCINVGRWTPKVLVPGTGSEESPAFHRLALQFWAIGSDDPTKPQLGIFQTTINTLSSVAWPWGEEEVQEGGGKTEEAIVPRGNKWGKKGRDAWCKSSGSDGKTANKS